MIFFLNSVFFSSTLPLKCYGYFFLLPSPLPSEVIFYPQESHYLASPSPLSSSPQLSRLSAILLCHSNLFLWRYHFVLTSSLASCVCAGARVFRLVEFCFSWSLVKGIGRGRTVRGSGICFSPLTPLPLPLISVKHVDSHP